MQNQSLVKGIRKVPDKILHCLARTIQTESVGTHTYILKEIAEDQMQELVYQSCKIEERLQEMSHCRIRKLVEEEKEKIRQGQYPEWEKIFGVCNSKSRILRIALKELL